jgi:hypothetical protein
MIRLLEGLVLLKEVDEIRGARYTGEELRRMYPEKIVVIRHNSYIYRDALCDVLRRNVTVLDDYVPLGEFVEHVKIQKSLLRSRIDFMEKTGSRFFDYMKVGNVLFVKIDAEMKHLLQHYQPFLASLRDAEHVVHCKLLGDLKIGFY